MREAVETILKALVDNPDAVEVRVVEGDRATVIEVEVAEGDVGKVIGRQGRTVKALRSLLHAAGVKQNRRFVLEIVE
ncbi:MAG TPA: KH domain-containing protein [Pyrinomonadaceae bacterium]|nr:KH domain-containing protein [Pyrinomonadaceae bacterium]